MKYLVLSVIFVCLAFPVFSEDANLPRYKALSDTMDRSIANRNSKLENYTQDMTSSGNMKSYASYKARYDSLTKALNESEIKLDLLIRTNDRTVDIKKERDHYESLIQQLQSVKSDYDGWLRNVQ